METERAETLPVFTEQKAQDFLGAQHARDGGAEGHADASGRHGAEAGFQSRLLHRLPGRNPRELVRARAARVAGQGIHVRVHLADLVPAMPRRGEKRQRPQTTAAGAQSFPHRRHTASRGGDDAEAGDDNWMPG